MKKKITVVIVEPQELPYVKTIENTLEAQQKIVGGLIEPIMLTLNQKTMREVSMVVNEEGKLLGLPVNKRMMTHISNTEGYMDYIAGTFFITAYNKNGENVGLNDNEVLYFREALASEYVHVDRRAL